MYVSAAHRNLCLRANNRDGNFELSHTVYLLLLEEKSIDFWSQAC